MNQFNKITTWLWQFLQRNPKNREELLSTIRTAEQEKILDSEAEGMLEGVLQVSQMQIRDIMIPRSQMVTLNEKQSLTEIISTIVEAQHSRYPVMDKDHTNIEGILLAKDLLRFTTPETQSRFSLQRLLQPAMIVPETQHLDKLLKSFKKQRTHMAIAIDEFGHIAGLITMEDVLEQIVGDIEDESDYDKDHYIRSHHNYYVIKAELPLEEFDEYFNVSLDHDDCESIGGLAIKQLGHIPKRNQEFTCQGFLFKILHADKRRIRLLRVEKL